MSVSVLMVRAFVDELAQRGIEAHSLLETANLSEKQLSDLAVHLESERFEAVAQRALALTGDPALGLAVGANVPERNLQVLGYLLLSSASLRSAYEHFRAYQSLLADAPLWTLVEEGQRATLTFSCSTASAETTRVAHDWALSLAYRMLRCFAPATSWSEITLTVAHGHSEDAEVYRRYLGREVSFGCAQTQLSFPRAWLDLPQVHSDLGSLPHGSARDLEPLERGTARGEGACGTFAASAAEAPLRGSRPHDGVAERLRAILRDAEDLSQFDVPSLARMVGLSASSLRRVLADVGLTPLRLLDEARCRVACGALKRSDSSIKNIGLQLGYADVSSFHRAFIRWTGRTPADYRNGVRAQSPATEGASAARHGA
jgi:AraC-like DNA-binding protein